MTGPRIQSEDERERILDAHRARQQEAYWGDCDEEPDEVEPRNPYEELCAEAAEAGERFASLSDARRHEFMLAWLRSEGADTVRDYVLDALGQLTERNLAEYLTNLALGADSGRFGRCLSLILEANLTTFIQRDINSWRAQQ